MLMSTKARRYRVAVVGCRSRGRVIGAAYKAHPRAELVALCDLDEERLNAAGALLGVEARFADMDEMIRQVGPDIVVIATGTEFHYPLAMRALEHGVHVDVEKPLCVDLEQADALVAKANAVGARTAVHHQGRTGPALRAVAKAINEGRIGAVRHVSATEKGYYGGYGLMNIGTHLINAMLELTGPCREVTALGSTGGRPITPEDVLQAPAGMGTIAGEYITATLRFDRDVTGVLRQHRLERIDPAADAIEIMGEEGRLFWHETGRAWWMPTPHFVPGEPQCVWQPLDLEVPEHYDPARVVGKVTHATVDEYCYVDEFVAALDEGREHACSFEQGRHVLEVMMGVFESLAYGRAVRLPQERRDHPLLRWRRESGLGPPAAAPRPYQEWLAREDERLGRRAGAVADSAALR